MTKIDRMLRRAEVEQLCGLSVASIYTKMAKGEFPRPRKIGPRGVRWPESVIKEWMANLPQAGAESAKVQKVQAA